LALLYAARSRRVKRKPFGRLYQRDTAPFPSRQDIDSIEQMYHDTTILLSRGCVKKSRYGGTDIRRPSNNRTMA
jgi:hypothetical protein